MTLKELKLKHLAKRLDKPTKDSIQHKIEVNRLMRLIEEVVMIKPGTGKQNRK